MGSRQPWSAAASLWNWAATRLHMDWTMRFIQEDEETVILTYSDELSRTYDENNRSTSDHATNKSTSCDDTRRTGGSFTEDSLSPSEQHNLTVKDKPRPNQMGSTNSSWQDSSAFKETRATLITTRPKAITRTLAVSPADALWLKNNRKYDKGRKSLNMQVDKTGSNSQENPSLNQNQGDKRKPYGAVGQMGTLRLSEDREMKKAGKVPEERTSQVCGNTDEERASVSLANPAHSPRICTTGLNPSATITAWEAGWNVTNAIQGIFVLGLPFALVQSGYVGLVLLVLSAWVCNHTGRILVACLYEDDPSGESDSVSKVIELLMTCTLYLVVSTSLLSESLSGIAAPRSLCSLVSLLFLLPCLLLTDLRPVSTLSLLCSLAHILISVLVMLYCLSRAGSWSWSSLSLSVNPEDFLVSVGVIIFSYTSQIFLPALEGSMEDRGEFNSMLGWTHGAACIMKTMFSLLAVLTWGADTSEVITDNLPSDLRPVVSLCLLAKALLSYPLPFYSAAEILQSCLFGDCTYLC
ncbi:Vesicular inhibitory amino acid transporter GABA [Channa argus]|uniref:Vesicular inhibitory amino acid transporter n=1 Tax=Channa argus TaxID=215402 RepID=A0A6G1QKN0_CHAAH|nr:Vesicular inhibitory amino acid transporter GABA [Channa argus]